LCPIGCGVLAEQGYAATMLWRECSVVQVTIITENGHLLGRVRQVLACHSDLRLQDSASVAAATASAASGPSSVVYLVEQVDGGPGQAAELRQLLKRCGEYSPVVVLAANPVVEAAADLLRLGVSGLVCFDRLEELLWSAIQTVRTGRRFICPSILEAMAICYVECMDLLPSRTRGSIIQRKRRKPKREATEPTTD
jgi:DNA-binding NarL/FixJ family response regulator